MINWETADAAVVSGEAVGKPQSPREGGLC